MANPATVGTTMGGPSGADISGTMLQENQAKPIRIPKEIPAVYRKHVRELYKTNPHWDINQLNMVARLVEYRDIYRKLGTELMVEGMMIENVRGDLITNPALASMNTVQANILNLERALAITINARNAAIPKQDREHTIRRGNGRGGKPKKDAAGKPNLRLA